MPAMPACQLHQPREKAQLVQSISKWSVGFVQGLICVQKVSTAVAANIACGMLSVQTLVCRKQ